MMNPQIIKPVDSTKTHQSKCPFASNGKVNALHKIDYSMTKIRFLVGQTFS